MRKTRLSRIICRRMCRKRPGALSIPCLILLWDFADAQHDKEARLDGADRIASGRLVQQSRDCDWEAFRRWLRRKGQCVVFGRDSGSRGKISIPSTRSKQTRSGKALVIVRSGNFDGNFEQRRYQRYKRYGRWVHHQVAVRTNRVARQHVFWNTTRRSQ